MVEKNDETNRNRVAVTEIKYDNKYGKLLKTK